MSHVAVVEIQILDLEALKTACKALGLEFRQNQKSFKWYGRWVNDYHGQNAAYRNGVNTKDYGKCEHAIGVPNNNQAYEIGITRDPKGGYKLVYDFYNGGYGLEKLAGKECCNLVQGYAKQVAIKQARKLGYMVTEKTDQEGNIELTATKY